MSLVIRTLILFASLLFAGCSEDNSTKLLSMAALLASPEKFDGGRVSVVGYLGRGADLYLTKDHAKIDDRSSSLILDLDTKERNLLVNSSCHEKYVEVVGIFGLISVQSIAPRLGLGSIESILVKKDRTPCS